MLILLKVLMLDLELKGIMPNNLFRTEVELSKTATEIIPSSILI